MLTELDIKPEVWQESCIDFGSCRKDKTSNDQPARVASPQRRMVKSESNVLDNTASTVSTSNRVSPGVIQRPITARSASLRQSEHRQATATPSNTFSSALMTSLNMTSLNQPASYLDYSPFVGAATQFGDHRALGRSSSDPLSISLDGTDSGSDSGSSGGPCRYKTELCRPFEEHGVCKYGEKCQFAHGRHELRVMSRHPKYKTDLCKTYHTTGLCPYGARCHFVHGREEEVAVQRENQLLQMEERLRMLKIHQQQLELQEQRQQLLKQQQQQHQHELLIAALMQANQQRSHSDVTSVKHQTTLTSSRPASVTPRSMLSSYQSVCDSLGSTSSNSPPSSVSDSPVQSPSFSMFNYEEPLNSIQSSTSAYRTVLPSCSELDSTQQSSSAFRRFSTADVAQSKAESSGANRTVSLLASLMSLPADTTVDDILCVSELLRAVALLKTNPMSATTTSSATVSGEDLISNLYKLEQPTAGEIFTY